MMKLIFQLNRHLLLDRTGWYTLLLILIWVIAVVLVNPVGDFPLNDDWRYALPLQSLITDGTYKMSFPYAPNLFLQNLEAYWLFGHIEELNFTYLRYFTLSAGIITALVLFHLLISLEKSADTAFLYTLILVFNPVFFCISFSYMSDVHFLFYSLLCITLYQQYIDKDKRLYRWLALMMAMAAFLVRQPGILIPIAFESALLIKGGIKNAKYWIIICLMMVAVYCIVEYGVKPNIEGGRDLQPGDNYLRTIIHTPIFFAYRLLKYNLMSVFYLGFFLFPFIGYFYRWSFKTLGTRVLAIVLLANITLAIILAMQGRYFPYGGNYIHAAGLGPLLLSDIRHLGEFGFWAIPKVLLFTFGVIFQLNGVLLLCWGVYQLKRAYQHTYLSTFKLFLLLLLLLYMGMMTIISFFDRYLLLPIAIVLLLLPRLKLNIVYLLLLAFISIAGTHDYLNWNRSAKRYHSELIAKGINPQEIDAGLALSGFYLQKTYNENASYIVATIPLEGYSVIQQQSLRNWLFFQSQPLFLLKRKDE